MSASAEALPDPWLLGLSIFSCPGWKGTVYPQKAPRTEWLKHYAKRFRAVEGNSTFYGLPKASTIESWIDQTYPGFAFSFKFPQTITHRLRLEDAEAETERFLAVLEPLRQAKRLTTTMLQLPPYFGPDRLPKLLAYLDSLPKDLAVAVEPRHKEFFAGGDAEERLDEELAARGVERILLDSRCLFSAPPETDDEKETQRMMPNLPVKLSPITDRPLVRMICGDSLEVSEPWLAEWAGHLAHWIERGKRPILFIHTANYALGPGHAARFLELIAAKGVAPPPLPDDGETRSSLF